MLLQYRLVKFNALETNENLAEYVLLHDKILLFLRYPRYIYAIEKKFSNSSALLLEELLKSGMETAQSIILRAYAQSEIKNDQTLKEFRDSFNDLVGDKYFIRTPEVSEDPVPQLKINVHEVFTAPELDLKELKDIVDSGIAPASTAYWTVNFDKFHQNFRDKVLVDVIERQVDSNAGECFQFILQLMYNKTDPWATTSNPISYTEIKQIIERKSTNTELVKYIEQYVSIIEKDECGFLKKNDEAGGGMYTINMCNAFQKLAWAVIENVITQKFGSKAMRIFRVVRSRKYIEQEDIQREAMIPGKEAKLFTYKLLEENFLQIQTIKKTGGGGMGPAKAFYLFRVNQNSVSSKIIGINENVWKFISIFADCFDADRNLLQSAVQRDDPRDPRQRNQQETHGEIDATSVHCRSDEGARWSRRCNSRGLTVIWSIRHQSYWNFNLQINETLTPPEKEIVEKTKSRLKLLESSEVTIDEMLLILQLFVYFQSPQNK